MSDSTRTVWDQGELIALDYLQRHDYAIIATNYVATKWGEIDIIAQKDDRLVFFEVKYRTGNSHGEAIECFTLSKRRKFLFAVRWYCMKHGVKEESVQVDFIAIQKESDKHRLTHLKNISMDQ